MRVFKSLGRTLEGSRSWLRRRLGEGALWALEPFRRVLRPLGGSLDPLGGLLGP
jgi:hypothetical protein